VVQAQLAITEEPEGRGSEALRHEALLYSGADGFIDGTLPFLRDGAHAGDPMLAVLDAAKIERLRDTRSARRWSRRPTTAIRSS
jgi:hypothetical protein